MFLAEAEVAGAAAPGTAAIERALDRWREFPASVVSDHGKACCRTARAWLAAMDKSLMSSGDVHSGPRWIKQRYRWGPSSWPIYWCEALEKKVLDCGALAAVSREIFESRGVECHPTQFIQRYTRDAAVHWNSRWLANAPDTLHWIHDDVMYHEGCAIALPGGEVRIWDPTPSWWVQPKQFEGYGAVLALRISPPAPRETLFAWGRHRIEPGRWHVLAADSGGMHDPRPMHCK